MASSTPKLTAGDSGVSGSGSTIREFMLDSRTPSGTDFGGKNIYADEEARREQETERQVQELLKESRIWRVANSAQWVAWGIVQAAVPGLDSSESTEISIGEPQLSSNHISAENEQKRVSKEHDKRPEGFVAQALLQGWSETEEEAMVDKEDEFDYLAYAQDRAMFFWGDVVGLGLVKVEELPEGMRGKIKVVPY